MTRGRSAAQAATPATAAPAAASGSFALNGIVERSSFAIVCLPDCVAGAVSPVGATAWPFAWRERIIVVDLCRTVRRGRCIRRGRRGVREKEEP
jgi:hypothetical protein